jgi:lipopolysaccharide/colanic/teichoic acid biosynthesis glycosyltransferase
MMVLFWSFICDHMDKCYGLLDMEALETYEKEMTIESEAPRKRYWYPVFKRGYDIFFALLGLMALAPLGLLVAVLIKLRDKGPVFYRQQRIGLHGEPFFILKFRTMTVDADKRGPSVTKDADPRITPIGRLLRKAKLDELPQLWNVLVGTMSLVGPRPEVPRYVNCYTPEQRQLLDYKPGITDLATLVFRNEETLLRTAADVEEFYIRHCIPRKFLLNLRYAKHANLFEDTLIIIETLCPYWFGIACGYIFMLALSLWLSYQLRFDFQVSEEETLNLHKFWFVLVPLQLAFLVWRKQLGGLLSYFDLPEMKQLAYGLGLAGVVQLLVWYVSDGDLMPARGIILINSLVAFVILVSIRAMLRSMRMVFSSRLKKSDDAQGILRVGIIGAGELGGWLARQLNGKGKSARHVEVFFDDDADKWHQELCGISVVGMPECILDGSWTGKLDEVILAIPSASPERIQQIQDILASAKIRSRPLPSLQFILGTKSHGNEA